MPGASLDRAALIATTVGSAAVLLDGTVVNTALPSLGRDLDLTLSGLQWVVSAYILALGSLLLVGGALGDRYGRRRVFVWGLWGFAVTSLLCGIAPGGAAEIAARVLQGAAAALLMPNSLGVLSSAHEGEARTRAIGLWSGFGALAGAAGPLLGGLLTDAVSWRAAFLVSVPACVVAALAARRIGGARGRARRRLARPRRRTAGGGVPGDAGLRADRGRGRRPRGERAHRPAACPRSACARSSCTSGARSIR